MRLGITGATGNVGGRVAALLAERGLAHRMRLIVRDPARAPGIDGAEIAVAEFGDAAACRAAFDGLDVLLLVSAGESSDRVEQHRTAVQAAVAAGVGHVVYTSFVGASADAEFTLARDHGATEDAIRDAVAGGDASAGTTWTFLRDSFYLDVLLPWAGEDHTLRGPAGDGRCGFVAREDVAQVAAAVLENPDPWKNRILGLTGSEAVTLTEAAARMSAALGTPYGYVDETMDEARASRASYGAPDWQVEAWISTNTAIGSGALAEVTEDVQQVLGRAPLRIEDVVTAADAGA